MKNNPVCSCCGEEMVYVGDCYCNRCGNDRFYPRDNDTIAVCSKCNKIFIVGKLPTRRISDL